MSKETLEHLSSLMDGELSRETGMFLTRRLSSDEALSETWHRYHLIRDCIRRPERGMPMVDLPARMRTALAAESQDPVHEDGQRAWMRPLAGMAIAASVALVAIIAVGPAGPPESPASASQPFTSPNAVSSMPATQAASFNPVAANRNERLNTYLMRHNQLAGSANKGFVSFVPIISASNDEAGAREEENSGDEQSAIPDQDK